MRFCVLAVVGLIAVNASAKRETPWAKFKHPSAERSEAIGGYSNGCLRGAIALPESGEGFRSIRRFRNRYYGHSELVDFVTGLGKKIVDDELRPVLIGDMSQPRGGLMDYGHRSHQLGLDVDIWFAKPPRTKRSKDTHFYSLVDRKAERIVKKYWDEDVIKLLRHAASDARVSRIFVHWVIKHQLCKDVSGDRAWLRKIRAWWGHDKHFHVRLECPNGSKDCRPQGKIKAGDGCGAERWFSAAEVARRKKIAEERARKRREARKKAEKKKNKQKKKKARKKKRKRKGKPLHPGCKEFLLQSQSG